MLPPNQQLNGENILAGKKTNWIVHEIEVYKLLF